MFLSTIRIIQKLNFLPSLIKNGFNIKLRNNDINKQQKAVIILYFTNSTL